MTMVFRFFSDTNLDGFVQLIAQQFRRETDVNLASREVTVFEANDQIYDLADQWGGVALDA
jgi:hypothetical protein